jgi:hypothetical protein
MSSPRLDMGRGEPPRVNTRGVLLAMGLFLGGMLVASLGLALFFPERIGATFVVQHPFPTPGVTTQERRARLDLEARQKALLQGAGGRLPIDAAMKAISERGTQAFDPVRKTP